MSERVNAARVVVTTIHHWPSGDTQVVQEQFADTRENLIRRWRNHGRPFKELADGGLQYEDQHSAPGIVWTSTTTLMWHSS